LAGPTVAPAVDELLARAADPARFRRWAEQVRQAGCCEQPVRLVGRVEEADVATGEVLSTYTSKAEPDGVTFKACGNRRASRCRPCSDVYRRDAWHLVAAGLRGGKGIPAGVAAHPRLFVTFTAPSFGLVHSRREHGGTVRPCQPRSPSARCSHGRPAGCWRRHEAEDPGLGEPICPDCFDYHAAVIWNALAPALWRRTTIYLRRELASAAGLTPAELARVVRVSYAKVAEYQRRGVVHFHALIRLDAAGDGERIEPPPPQFTAEILEHAVREAARRVAVPWPSHPEASGAVPAAGWGDQLEIHHITTPQGPEDLSAEAVAAYIAKYATKSTEGLGALDHRVRASSDIAHVDLGEHVARLVRACWKLGGRPDLAGLRLRQWAHQLGFGGHFLTKSRRYSTTFGALRRARAEHAMRARFNGDPRDAWGCPAGAGSVVILAQWRFAGRGYTTSADADLAAGMAEEARVRRQVAREESKVAACA
jgi:Replication initiator protein, pSAM2